jgi:hypothetical protein
MSNTLIFQRIAYKSSFSIASARERAGIVVLSFHSIGLRPFGAPR